LETKLLWIKRAVADKVINLLIVRDRYILNSMDK
jgi:hypothetical protein